MAEVNLVTVSEDTGTSNTEESTTEDYVSAMDDNNYSRNIITNTRTAAEILANPNEIFGPIKRSFNLYERADIDICNKRYRFGILNPYETLSTTREFLFFTKPDLNIITRDDESGAIEGSGTLAGILADIAYWEELYDKHQDVIKCLQISYEGKTDPFNHLLENMCISNLDIPSLEAEVVDTPTNAYGVGYSYRGSSEASNDGFDFSLEFKDTKYLPVYHFFKAYEEYETLKHHGTVSPWRGYIENKVLHDQFSIYKFLVDEDMETIIYYAKFYGVYPKSLPRDVFSSAAFDSGLSYSVNFKSAFFEDMDPQILNDFNDLNRDNYEAQPYRIDVYNDELSRMDNRPAKAAYIVSEASEYAPGGRVYKLKWRGSDTY